MTGCEYISELHTEIRKANAFVRYYQRQICRKRVGCDGVVLVIARMRLTEDTEVSVGELRWYHGEISSLLRHAVRTFLLENLLISKSSLKDV